MVLLIAVAWGWANSEAGEAKIRALVLPAIQDALQGRVGLERLELNGRTVVLRGVTLETPEGEPVASIAEVRARVSLLPLLGHTIRIDSAEISRPRLTLRSDARGLNLSRAIAPRHPPSGAPSGPSPWSFDLGALGLSDGAASFLRPEQAPEVIAVQALSGAGSAFLGGGSSPMLRADLRLQAQMTAPVRGPVSISVKASGEGEDRRVTVTLEGPGVSLAADGDVTGAGAHVVLHRLSIAPSTARAFVPTYPLQVPVSLQGTLTRDAGRDTVALTADAGTAHVTAQGTLDFARLSVDGLEVHGTGLDVHALTGQGRKTSLSFDLKGALSGRSLETLNGALTLSVPPSRVAGEPVGPISVVARAKDGQVTLDRFDAQLPGVSVKGGGTLNAKTLDLTAQLHASDLDALQQTFGGLTGSVLPPLSGSGDLTVHLRGPTRHPSLTAQGTVKSLRSGSNAVSGLTLDVKVPDLRKPLEANATVSAGALQIGGTRLQDLATSIQTQGRRLVADFRTHGATELSLHLEGLLDVGGQGVRVDTLRLSWPREAWTLERPTHLLFAGARLEVSPLTLRSADQRLFLEGTKSGSRVNAHLALSGVQLDRLPRLLTDPYGLSGTLDAELRANGRLPKPAVTARVSLADGAALGYSGLSLLLDGRYQANRATGTLTAAGLGASLKGQFDVPIQALRRRSHEPLALDLEVPKVDLGDVLCRLSRLRGRERLCPDDKPLAQGSASAEVHVSGDAARPQLSLTVRGDQVRTATLPPANLSLVARNDAQDALGAKLDVQALGGSGTFDLQTSLVLGELLARPPSRAEIERRPVDLSVKGTGFDLAPLSKAGVLPRRLKGTLAIQAHLHGPLRAPEGDLRIDVANGAIAGSPRIALSLTAAAAGDQVSTELQAMQAGKPLAQVRASVARSLAELRAGKSLGDATFRVEANAGPVVLDDDGLYAPGADEKRKDQQIHGTITLALGVSGTLNDPTGTASITVDHVGVGEDALGHGTATFRYANGKASLNTALQSTQGGTLRLDTEAAIDLTYRALRKGVAFAQAPVKASLQARQFDLSFLSGLSPAVRKIGGPLQADATLKGSLANPTWQGALEWTKGNLTLTGLGQYHDIHVALHALNDQIALSDFTAQSGGGTLKASASANHAGDHWVVNGTANADRFPVVSDDQLVATASVRTTFSGDVTSKRVNLQHVDIPEAHIELPQVARKDLQALQRPADVVLLRDGRIVDKGQRRDPLIRADLAKVLGRREAVAALSAETAPSREVWLTLNAPRNIWIRGEDINAEVGFSEGFRVEYSDKAQLFGEVRVLRARLDVLGRRFDLRNDSSVRFAGDPIKPFVNVTGVYKNDQAQVTVYLTLRGQGKDVTLKVSSDPPLSESQIYTLLATGRITLKRGSGATLSSGQAASVVGSLVASQFKKSLASKLPLDVLSIEAGAEGLQGSKLEAGTYVTDKIYVGYTGQLGADPAKGENSNAVKLEYQISPHWSLEMEYGDARAGGADLIWSKDY